MLANISLLTGFIFAVTYPLCFWISYKDPLKDNFHRFHLGLPCVISGVVTVVIILRPDLTQTVKNLSVAWFSLLFLTSLVYWKKEYPDPRALTIPIIIGVCAFIQVQNLIINPSWQISIIAILAGLIFSAILFAMNLGHWYLNVHGLPIEHLKRTTYIFWILVAIRLLWDLYVLTTGTVFYKGEDISLLNFMLRMDGYLLIVGIFFGTLFPVIATYFACGTLKLKNTQATTGILYVILVSVILGDLAYKYYLINYNIPL